MREKFLDYMKNDCPICTFFSIEPLECKAGYSKAQMPLSDNQINGLGIAHGGALFTLADMTMVMVLVAGGNICVTLSSNVSYFVPAKKGPLVAEAFLISETKKIAHVEVNIKDAEETLVCRCSFIAYKKPAAMPEVF
ncbi:MAG: PaaI family thioesterase [Deltaproteobacteria bacterium]|jgi:acyl-CoA thioesterase|nr:PaaI family thioesterase [Deltaproteobacteria bacterium]